MASSSYGVGLLPSQTPPRGHCVALGPSATFRVPLVWRTHCNNAQASSTGGHDDKQKESILESLNEVSSSLAALSEAIGKVSSAVQLLAGAIRAEDNGSDSRVPVPTRSNGEQNQEELVPAHLRDRNALAHGLAFRLQQSFVQSRVEGLGKPFEVAAEDFVSACMEARRAGIGMHELQLQLILADGALTGPFAVSSDDPLNNYIMSEEARIRAAWIRYVYVTLTEVDAMQQKEISIIPGTTETEMDPSDMFVKQVIKMAVEEGYNLDKLKLEQQFSGPTSSPSAKALRQGSFLILLTFEKAMDR